MNQYRFLLTPLLAALVAATASARTDTRPRIAINVVGGTPTTISRVYVGYVVLGPGAWQLSDGKVWTTPHHGSYDATQDDLTRAERGIEAAGFPTTALRSWLVRMPALSEPDTSTVTVGEILLDMGTAQQARAQWQRLSQTLTIPSMQFASGVFLQTNCDALPKLLLARARERAEIAASLSGGTAAYLDMSYAPTRSPGLPLSAAAAFNANVAAVASPPPVEYASKRVPDFSDGVTCDGQLNAEFALVRARNDAARHTPKPLPHSVELPSGSERRDHVWWLHQGRSYMLGGRGQYAATLGRSTIAVPAEASVVAFSYGGDARAFVGGRKRALQTLGIAANDMLERESATGQTAFYVRVRPANASREQQIVSIMGANDQAISLGANHQANVLHYAFLRDCSPARADAMGHALEQSRAKAALAALLLHRKLGPMIAQTDWTSYRTNAICGFDPSKPMAALIDDVGRSDSVGAYYGGGWVDFQETIYAAWRIGDTAVPIVGNQLVDTWTPFVTRGAESHLYRGDATITPNAFIVETSPTQNTWVSQAIPARPGETAQDVRDRLKRQHVPLDGVFNATLDCGREELHAFKVAVESAILDGRGSGSFVEQGPRFLNVACLNRVTGKSNTFTLYDDTSPSGIPDATDTLTVFGN